MKLDLKTSLKLLIALGLSHLSLNAFAVGSAGCGLGSVVFSGNQWWKQLLSMTTNHLTLSQAFGITSGTSNCASGLFGETQKQEDYIVANFVTLQRESAQGTGESLNAFASVLGCQSEAYDYFGSYTQNQYKILFNSQDPKIVLSNFKNIMKNENKLSKECSLLNI
ncbi:DUF3015 family protein [Fluviispira multicolorata]|uniref:DUF3015 domain-containing protein n=1 Tax=Fluviispira multicolorata TaxID=2654512 RepID=A0A833JH82_9BACT|nr:DUF3015 family protein [Fluviispira multicolorata]KAB8033257.1 DUF3015 domain-containing protein [Fluviispira multicolorata]